MSVVDDGKQKLFALARVRLRPGQPKNIDHTRGNSYILNTRRFFDVCAPVLNSNSLTKRILHVCVFVSVTREIPGKSASYVYLIQNWLCSEFLTYVYVYWIRNSLAWPPPQKIVRNFCFITFSGFCQEFSWRIFLGTLSHKNEEKHPVTKSTKKSGGSKIKIREESVLPQP